MDVTERLEQSLGKMAEALQLLSSGPLPWYFEQIVDRQKMLFGRFAPVKKGDRVELVQAPAIDIDTRPGWQGSEHFLVPGALATVQGVDTHKNRFTADLVFDDESYLLISDSTPVPVDRKHTYGFDEAYFRKIEEPRDE